MKRVLLTLVIASFAFGAFAQFQMGAKVGLNVSKIKPAYDLTNTADERADMYDDIVSTTTGTYFAIVMNTGGNIFSFQPELAYAQKGFKFKIGDEQMKYRYNYIDLKPLFNVGGGTSDWKVYANFGPSLSFWLSKKAYDSDGKGIDDSQKFDDDMDEDGMGVTDIRADIGFVFGVGFKYHLGPGWVLINPRYEWGFVPQTIYDLGSDGYGEVNRTFNLNVGYLFEF